MSNKKTYLVITPFFPTPEQFFGSYLYDQVVAIRDNSDYEVVVLKPLQGFKAIDSSYVVNGITVHHLACYNLPSNILVGATDWLNRRLFRKTLEILDIKVENIKFAHIHTALLAVYGAELKWLNPEIKTIIQYHDLDPVYVRNGRFADKMWNLKYKAVNTIAKLNTFDLHVSISKRTEENLRYFPEPAPRETYQPYLNITNKLRGLVEPVKIKNSYVLYNGVDLEKFFPKEKVDSPYFRIGCIGNYQEIKCHRMLIDAVSILVKEGHENIRLSLVGNNPPEDFVNMQQYVKDSDMSEYVEFVQPLKHEQLTDYYNSLDLFVLPSCFEGFGCVYTEAYACGVPFIGCYGQGIEDVIEPSERGKWLVPVHDTNRLAQNIEHYMQYRDEQKLCEPIDINVLITEYLNYINSKI